MYSDNIGKKVRLFGYTATSLVLKEALHFAWENSESGHHKDILHIKNSSKLDHYFVNGGAFGDE